MTTLKQVLRSKQVSQLNVEITKLKLEVVSLKAQLKEVDEAVFKMITSSSPISLGLVTDSVMRRMQEYSARLGLEAIDKISIVTPKTNKRKRKTHR